MANNKPGCLTAILNLFGGKKEAKLTPKKLPYRLRDDFFSPAEAAFYHVLKNMVADHLLIFTKTSLGEIFFVTHPKENYSYYNKIDRKHVDFLLCDPKSLKPLFAIELDDSSHRRPDRTDRDDFVNEVFRIAKLPLVRVPVRQAYSTHELADLFKSALQKKLSDQNQPEEKVSISSQNSTPTCPKCGVPMLLRIAKRGNKPGMQFYGCSNYPRCREMIPITQAEQ